MKVRGEKRKVKRVIIRGAAVFAIVFSVLITVLFGKSGIKESDLPIKAGEYRGILTLWNVDTFEGGTGSRKQFLSRVSRGYEKKRAGVLVLATDHTKESAEKSMREGVFPDLISFGTGMTALNAKSLPISGYSAGGAAAGEVYAVPWARGGYCMIENPDYKRKKDKSTGELYEEPTIVSQGEYTSPLVAMVVSGGTLTGYEIMSPMDAYVAFTSGKSRYLVGTQRDINRLINRGMEFISRPISVYNDIFQYISITTNDQTKYEYAAEFVRYLISEEVQLRLDEIGLYSCYCQVKYADPDMKEMQNAKSEYCLSAFATEEEINAIRGLGAKAVAGDKENLNKIKKLLVIP